MLREIAFVEDQQELGPVGFQTLYGVRNSGGKIPHVANTGIRHKTFAVPIDGSNTCVAIEHDCPFCCGMPMQLPYPSDRKPHQHTRQFPCDWELPNRNLV